MVTPRQQSILESVANHEVVYGTHFNGFYYNRVLQFELAAEDQAYLRSLYEAGEIWHKPIDPFDFEVRLTEKGSKMAQYEIGEEIRFTRKITETNPDRVINVDEQGRIVAVAADGTYTVELQAGDPPFSGITDNDIEPALDDSRGASAKQPASPSSTPAPAEDDDQPADDENS